MKPLYVLLIFLALSGSANALCFDISFISEGSAIGMCEVDSDDALRIPVTAFFSIWVLINVALGQALITSRVHLSVKYILFILGLPLSPLVVVTTLVLVTISKQLDKLKKTKSSVQTQEATAVEEPLVITPEHSKDTAQPPIISQGIRIGEYTFSSTNQSLSKGDETNILEPKCIQVLSYLVENQPRIVSLEELHSNVWENQVVTDTAVRRVIGKLRQAFTDNDTKNPKYIKSVMKRGYQLIAEVQTRATE